MSHPIHFKYHWNEFLQMFALQHTSEFYGQECSEFAEFFEGLPGEQWDAGYLGFVSVALHRGGNPSEMLRGFTLACLAGHRMILDDGAKSLRLIMKALLQHGAIFPHELLFQRRYTGDESLEEEIQDYPVRALLIDVVMPLQPFDVWQYADWPSIPIIYWEDLEYRNPAAGFDYERFGCLKCHSTVLQNLTY
jgi:hypothetical protein